MKNVPVPLTDQEFKWELQINASEHLDHLQVYLRGAKNSAMFRARRL